MTGTPDPSLTGRPHSPCSHPPKRRGAAYDRRPSAGPGRKQRRANSGADRQRVRVILPGEPPRLTPAAARVLLRVLLKAQVGRQREEHQ